MQMLIYNILPKKKRKGSEVDFDVVRPKVWAGKEILHIMDKPKDETMNKALSRLLRSFRDNFYSFKQYWMRCHYQGSYPECLPRESEETELVRNITYQKEIIICL